MAGYAKANSYEVKGSILFGRSKTPTRKTRAKAREIGLGVAELKIYLISVSDSIRHQLVSVLARGLEAFGVRDDEVEDTTLIEHRIGTGNSLPFREWARQLLYAHRIFIERDLDRLLQLGILYETNPGECPYDSQLLVVAKKDETLRMWGEYSTSTR